MQDDPRRADDGRLSHAAAAAAEAVMAADSMVVLSPGPDADCMQDTASIAVASAPAPVKRKQSNASADETTPPQTPSSKRPCRKAARAAHKTWLGETAAAGQESAPMTAAVHSRASTVPTTLAAQIDDRGHGLTAGGVAVPAAVEVGGKNIIMNTMELVIGSTGGIVSVNQMQPEVVSGCEFLVQSQPAVLSGVRTPPQSGAGSSLPEPVTVTGGVGSSSASSSSTPAVKLEIVNKLYITVKPQ
eukprot:scpid57955/ scgid17677/ 